MPRRKLVLTLSLALNLFLLGSLIAGAVTHYAWPPPPPGGPAILPDPRQLKAALSPEDRQTLEDAFKAHRAEFRPLMTALRDARRRAVDALTAQPFDEAELRAAFAQLRERDNDMTAHAQDMLVDLASKMGDDGREDMARLMRRRP